MQLEERIDTLSKECRAHKTSADLSQLMLKEVREELQQVSNQNLMIIPVNKYPNKYPNKHRSVELSGWPSGLRRQTQEHILPVVTG